MQFAEFERIMSQPRMGRYVRACGGNTRKAMTLYRKNLKLSQELFTVVSCFEVALRNAIDGHYSSISGRNWLRDSLSRGGMFDDVRCRTTAQIIRSALKRLGSSYTHYKLLAEMDFGFWRYLFAKPQYREGGKTLLRVFPAKPRSTPSIQYNHTYVFNQLGEINKLRNRIAHHESICFSGPGSPVKNTFYARRHYNLILELFQWLTIDEAALLYGIDHINEICTQIDNL